VLRADFMDADHIRLRRDDDAKVLQWQGFRLHDVVACASTVPTEFTDGVGVRSLFP